MPVNGATAPNVGVLQTYLDSVYRQANVRFTVTEKTGFRFNIDSVGVAGLARAGSGINKYSAEMRMIRDKFAIDTTYDKKASYIFVVSAFEGGGLDGFMVRGRSMGFVASGANKRTYAHELGHGAFGLEHTFPEIGQSLSNNLMDYGDSTHLTHKQCKDIALAFKKAKKDPNLYWDTVSNGNTYYVFASDGQTKITLFYGADGDVNPLLTGITTFPHIKSSFPKYE